MLSPERWQIVERVFHQALERPPSERHAFVDSSCGGDDDVRREVEALLAADSSSDSGDTLAARVAADWAAGRAPADLTGREIAGYRIVSLLGAGGMGEVYLADDLSLGRRVALKLLPVQFSEDTGRLRRFTEEARAASALNHPNIITVHHIGEVERRRFIVTEFIEGDTLRARLARGPLPEADAVAIAKQVASALQAAHAAGIVHRDIKPENVMIRPDGYVKVLDFGLAKLAPDEQVGGTAGLSQSSAGRTRAGAVIGTPHYMAPEQALGAAVDARADIFSLSIVLHEMVTGVLPFGSSDDAGPTHGSQPVPSGALSRVLRRGLAIDPASRYQTIEALLADLDRGAGDAAVRLWREPRRRWATAAAVVVASAALGILGWSRLSAPAATRLGSVAVLPFTAIGGDEDVEHLTLGMADAVITGLGRAGTVRVPPTATIRHFVGDARLPAVIGRELDVEAVLTGSLLRAGDRLRVSLQLTRVSDGLQMWAGRFDEQFTGIFAVQDSITEQVASALLPDVGAAPAPRRGRRTADPEAYEVFLKAQEAWNRRTPDSIRRAIALYEEAIAKDPDFAEAYAGLANSYVLTASGLLPMERFPKARMAAMRAIALDDSLSAAHNALAFMSYKFDWLWDLSEREFKRAIELDPSNVLAHHWYGEFLSVIGRHDEAIERLARAQRLDPYSTAIRVDVAAALVRAQRFDEAAKVLQDASRRDPAAPAPYNALHNALRAAGRDDEAFEAFVRFRTMSGAAPAEIEQLRARYRQGGMRAFARAELDRFLALDKSGKGGTITSIASTIARNYALLGDTNNALSWLEESTRRRDDGPLTTRVAWYWTPYRDEPRFKAIEKIIGMP